MVPTRVERFLRARVRVKTVAAVKRYVPRAGFQRNPETRPTHFLVRRAFYNGLVSAPEDRMKTLRSRNDANVAPTTLTQLSSRPV